MKRSTSKPIVLQKPRIGNIGEAAVPGTGSRRDQPRLRLGPDALEHRRTEENAAAKFPNHRRDADAAGDVAADMRHHEKYRDGDDDVKDVQ